MKGITKYYSEETLVGMKISSLADGTVPLTPEKEPLQIIALNHKKGGYLKAHTHTPTERKTQSLQECLVVLKGKIKIDIYTTSKKYIRSILVKEHEAFLLIEGGLGIHIIDDAQMFEFKNGPFVEDKELI